MTDFWGNASGDEKKAFVSGFSPIPEGTMAPAEVLSALFSEDDKFGNSYEIKWKILEGDYRNRMVFQKIRAFDSDPIKADRAKNMLMLLFKIFSMKVPSRAPNDMDLIPMAQNIAVIKIGFWENDGKNGNFVREVHPLDQLDTPQSQQTIESAFSRNSKPSQHLDGDIPF